MTSDQFIAWSVGVIVGLAIFYFFARFVFDIDKRNRLLKAQVDLLGRIAKRHGAPHDEIDTIVRNANKSSYK